MGMEVSSVLFMASFVLCQSSCDERAWRGQAPPLHFSHQMNYDRALSGKAR
jgi:hypothetical protein